jgi:predicted RNA methylase
MTTTVKPSSKRAAIVAERTRKHREAAARATDGFVRTPDPLAEKMCNAHPELGSFPRDARVLEPSAGDGALVRWILDTDSDVHVVAVEPSSERTDGLYQLAKEFPGRVTVHVMTFEAFELAHTGGHLGDPDPFDAVIMNPPFGDSSRDLVWVDHVRLAWELLRPGAQLVSIVPNGYGFRNDKAHKDMRAWAQERGVRYEQLGRDAFEASGCGVSAGMLTLVKPLPARPDGLPLWLARPAEGEPVDVTGWWAPTVTAVAALDTPVQAYAERSDGDRRRVLRLVGTCFVCHRPLWWHDGRGDASVWEGCAVTPEDGGKTGPPALLCLNHFHDGDTEAAARNAARPYWTAGTGEPTGPRVYPMDLCEGLYAEVTGLDPRGDEYTFAGQLLADPIDTGDGRVTVRLRGRMGTEITLSGAWDAPVNVLEADTSGPAPRTPATSAPVDNCQLDMWAEVANLAAAL